MASKTSSSRKSASKSSSSGSKKRASSSKRSREPREVTDGGAIADNRAAVGQSGQGVQGGVVDQMTRRSARDVMQGHFCTIDRTHSGIDKDVQEILDGRDGYGVYMEAGEVDAGGFPKTAIVRLHDTTGQTVTVPYESLRPVDNTERRL